MGVVKITEKSIGSTPSSKTNFLITQPERQQSGEALESLRRITTAMVAKLLIESGGLLDDESLADRHVVTGVEESEDGVEVTYADGTTASLDVGGGVDGGFVEDGYLYLTKGGVVMIGPLGPFSGGGGETTGAKMTMRNESGWLSKTIAYGAACEIAFDWSSTEDDIPTGDGSVQVTVGGSVRYTATIQQGVVTLDIGGYLAAGRNSVRVKVSDIYGNSRTIAYTINAAQLSLKSTFDDTLAYEGAITYTYTPVGALTKTVHFLVDNVEIGRDEVTVSNRQQSRSIPAQTHGAHTLQVYFTCEIDGSTVQSNKLYYDLICLESGNTAPIIACSFDPDTIVKQYQTINIPYSVYTPGSMTSQVELRANGKRVNNLAVDRSQQVWSYRAQTQGTLALQIASGDTVKPLVLNVQASEMDAEAETEALKLYLTSEGRDNNEEHPEVWKDEDHNVTATLSGFAFASDGWVQDADGITVLRVTGDARVTIPYQIFGTDARIGGRTVEVEFATHNVLNYDAEILSCMQGGRGISLTAQKATLKSEQSEISMQYKEDEHVRVSFVIGKRAENRLVYIYVNGIMSGTIQYPAGDDFQQTSPVGISIGSNSCGIDIYNIRVYDQDLTRHQMLNNWIADTQDVDLMMDRFSHNQVYDEYGNITVDNLPNDLPYFIITCPELPQYKGDKKTVSVRYVDPLNPAKCWTAENVQLDVQGTSSQYYARKNYKAKYKSGFVMANGTTVSAIAIREGQIPTNVFCYKADVASSEGANNVELARLYNDACPYKTPAQVADNRVRQGIDGTPVVIFWNNGTETSFIGRYNENYDKSTEEVFGFATPDESWEIKNNTSNRVIWKNADYTGTDWLNDFEGRFPDGYEHPEQLAEFAAWVVSTDRDQATGNTLPAPVTYDGVKYTKDTAEYRLAKFKAEAGNYMELDSAVFYYLFTELFLMVDSRAKNAFPSFIGSEV